MTSTPTPLSSRLINSRAKTDKNLHVEAVSRSGRQGLLAQYAVTLCRKCQYDISVHIVLGGNDNSIDQPPSWCFNGLSGCCKGPVNGRTRVHCRVCAPGRMTESCSCEVLRELRLECITNVSLTMLTATDNGESNQLSGFFGSSSGHGMRVAGKRYCRTTCTVRRHQTAITGVM